MSRWIAGVFYALALHYYESSTRHFAMYDYARRARCWSRHLVLRPLRGARSIGGCAMVRWLRRDMWVQLDRWADDGGRA